MRRHPVPVNTYCCPRHSSSPAAVDAPIELTNFASPDASLVLKIGLRAGATGQPTVRADSGFHTHSVASVCRKQNVRVSITIRQRQSLHNLIEAIPEVACTPIPYWMEGAADVAETAYTPFESKPDAAPVRLIVRRVNWRRSVRCYCQCRSQGRTKPPTVQSRAKLEGLSAGQQAPARSFHPLCRSVRYNPGQNALFGGFLSCAPSGARCDPHDMM